MCVYVCVYLCVCVCEREREKETVREKEQCICKYKRVSDEKKEKEENLGSQNTTKQIEIFCVEGGHINYCSEKLNHFYKLSRGEVCAADFIPPVNGASQGQKVDLSQNFVCQTW